MSAPRFAAITASILARKGEARPIDSLAKPAFFRDDGPREIALSLPAEAALRQETFARAAIPMSPAVAEKSATPQANKKVSIRMTVRDYERLGILAVKKGRTRQSLLQDAVEVFLASAARENFSECACLTGAGCGCR